MKYLRLLILLLMAISLVFRVDGVWVLLTVSLLVTLNAPMMMIVTAAMVIGLLEAYAWFADYVLFHLLVYGASAVAVLLSLAYQSVESPVMWRIRRGVKTMAGGKMAEEKLRRLEEFVDSLLKEDSGTGSDGEAKKP